MNTNMNMNMIIHQMDKLLPKMIKSIQFESEAEGIKLFRAQRYIGHQPCCLNIKSKKKLHICEYTNLFYLYKVFYNIVKYFSRITNYKKEFNS